MAARPLRLTLRYFDGCPSWKVARKRLEVFAVGGEPVGLACRVYRTPDGLAGSPTTEQLRAALHAASASTSGAQFDRPSSASDSRSRA